MKYLSATENKEKHICISTLIRRLFFVPKCAACGKRIEPIIDKNELNHGIPCFCVDCLPEWHRARTEMCHTCGRPAGKCICMPQKNTFMQPTIPCLFFYHPSDIIVTSKAIYTLKRKKYIDLFDFITEELSVELSELISSLGLSAKECIFTFIPRTYRALTRYGFDQSELLAKNLCSKLGGTCMLPLLIRRGGKEQKKLTKKQRKENVNSAIFANRAMKGIKKRYRKKELSDLLSGKTVILIDDIITTGASLKRGINELKAAGSKCVIVAAVARCEITKKEEK